MADIQFMRNKKYGTMGTNKNGWTKEVCNVSWNQKQPKLDIREWSPDYRKMSRGITLTKQEAKRLLAILAAIDFEEFDMLGVQPESPMQVRPVYQNAVPQGQSMAVASAANCVQMAQAPIASPVVSSVAASPVVNTGGSVANAPQSLVVTTPEIVSMQEDTGIPEGFFEEPALDEVTDAETEDPADLQSMASPVTAI